MKTKTLTTEQALYCANIFNDYFGKFNRIDQYMRDQKLSQISDVPGHTLTPETAPGLSGRTNLSCFTLI